MDMCIKKQVKGLRAVALCFICFGIVISGAEARLYVYTTPDGSRLITDHPMGKKGYRLLFSNQGPEHVGAVAAGRRITLTKPKRDYTAVYDPLIRRVAKKQRIEPALLKAIIHVESGFNARAVSKKGASGLMQLMPATAKRYGVKNIFDPTENVHAGARYLNDLMRLYHNNKRLALAAYNAGEKSVEKYRGIPPYSETRNYVYKVLVLANRYTTKYYW